MAIWPSGLRRQNQEVACYILSGPKGRGFESLCCHLVPFCICHNGSTIIYPTAMALQLFNFSSYIDEQLRPLETNYFHVQSLAGGFTNETVRVSFDPPIQFHPTSRETTTRLTLKSVVLKYAPPYLASDPTQPMSVCRQSIEAKALQVLTGDAYPELVDLFNDTPNIRIPKLIYHDIQKNVLWIEDLGDTFTLSEYLLSDTSADPSLCGRLGIHAQKIAQDLGRFLVKLYKATTNPPKELITYLDSTNNTSLSTKTYIANITADILRGEGIADADVLAERVRRGLLEDDQGEFCLGMVDFWTESVLIGKENGDDDTTNSRSCQCGLVDWEYFGVSSAASELGMFRKLFSLLFDKFNKKGIQTIYNSGAFTYPHVELYFFTSDKRKNHIILYNHVQFLLFEHCRRGMDSFCQLQTAILIISWPRTCQWDTNIQ